MLLGIILWFLLGILTGLIFSLTLYRSGKQTMALIVLGVIGALIGGAFSQMLSQAQTSFNIATVFISTLGALLLIVFYRNISPQS